jgi:acyl-CoA thioester hydrolase
VKTPLEAAPIDSGKLLRQIKGVASSMENLILTHRGVVYPHQCDHMGHMNVMWYVGKFDEATWNLFAEAGMDASYLREQSRALAAVQQNITYKRELLAGDVIAVRSGVLEVREKVVRFVHEMMKLETSEIAAICELTAVHMDAVKRKTCPFPSEIVTRLRELSVSPAVYAQSG